MAAISAELAGGADRVAFLDLIGFSEGTSSSPITQDGGYDVIVSGIDGPGRFDSYIDHPFADGRGPVVVRESPLLESTASGRYQILLRWWLPYKAQLGLTDFSPISQDRVALQQMRERGAIGRLIENDVQGAIEACSNIWASFPGNDYGQGGKSMAELLAKYEALLA
jgi:muramidase (phage lysozyme)